MLKKTTFLVSVFLPFTFSQGFAGPIEEIFPKAFKESPRINITPKKFAEVDGYKIEEFSEEEKNRNHWDDRGKDPVQFLAMHYTACNFPTTMNLFTKDIPDGRVSAHYVLTEYEKDYGVKGGIPIQVVPEDKRSWHAGVSSWRGVKNLNATSIGIENINMGFVKEESKQPKWFVFDPDQIDILGKLSSQIIKAYSIPPYNVIGHADIAPKRKQDPGILFPWEKLYENYGIGAWLSEKERNESFISTQFLSKERLPQDINEAFFLNCLRDYGYDVPEGPSISPDHHGVVKAFKSHFSHNQHPEAYNATLDKQAMLWAWGLVSKYPQKK